MLNGEDIMKWTLEGSLLTVVPTGRMDTEHVPALETEIFETIDNCKPDKLIFDMSEVAFISSIGLRLMLKVKRRITDMEIVNANSTVFEVFYITGLNESLHVKPPKDYINESEYIAEVSKNLEDRSSVKTKGYSMSNQPDAPLSGINDTTEEFQFVSVVEMFRDQVKKHPDKLAVVSPKGSLTYSKLDELSDKVANVLLFMGVQPDDVIMVMLPRDVDIYIATIGILKAGAAYTVVNVKYPDERIAYIYKDADCRYMISDNPTVLDRLELIADVLKKRPLFMEALLSISYSAKPQIRIKPSDLCYLIYTSGSTGNPKGVMIEHGNLTNFVYPTSKNHEANGITRRGEVILAMAQMTFDVSVMEEYLGLTSGMTVALATDEEIMNPLLMKEFMLKNKVDAAVFTPAYMNTLLSIPELEEALRNIKTYDFGAEAFPANIFDKIRAINPDAYVMNGYGPTETTISCTMKVIESADDITIGIPNANVYAFIVDSKLNELPKGKTGELLICGLGVGRGYKNLPEKTNESFVNFNGMRAYRTGDLACINENDEIEFHGRIDNQVKLRGLRIELDEVEKAIARHEAVKQSAVKVFDNKVLVGYYTLRDQGCVSITDIRIFIEKSLAHYMVPEVFVELDDMPMTANKKIDRNALPRPKLKQEEIVPAQNDDQAFILEVLTQILGEISVGITTDFIESGLTSLDTMVLATRLDEHFGVDVKFSDIYENPTVLQLERMLMTKPKRKVSKIKDRYPCFGTVASCYHLFTADESSTQWNLPYLYSGERSAVYPQRLRDAVVAVFNAHKGLWCRFTFEDDTVWIVPDMSHSDYDVPVKEITDEEFADIRSRLVRPFSSDGSLLFRAEIYVTPTKVHLHLDFSHMIMDGDSYEIILKDIDRAYNGNTLEAETFTFYEMINEQHDFLESSGRERTIQYYRQLFSESPAPTSFHKDKHESALASTRYDHRISVGIKEIQKMCSQLKISDMVFFMGLLSAYVAKDGGKNAAYFPVAYNGRNNSRAQNTVGFLTQMFFALSVWEKETTVGEYLQSLQKQILLPMSFTCQPYLEMLADFPELFTYGFSFLGEVPEYYPLGNASLKAEALSDEGGGGLYGILQEIMIRDGYYYCSTEYRTNEYEEDSIRKMVEALDIMLERFDPGMKLNELLKTEAG